MNYWNRSKFQYWRKVIDNKHVSMFECEFKIVINVYYQKSHDETRAKYEINFVSWFIKKWQNIFDVELLICQKQTSLHVCDNFFHKSKLKLQIFFLKFEFIENQHSDKNLTKKT